MTIYNERYLREAYRMLPTEGFVRLPRVLAVFPSEPCYVVGWRQVWTLPEGREAWPTHDRLEGGGHTRTHRGDRRRPLQ